MDFVYHVVIEPIIDWLTEKYLARRYRTKGAGRPTGKKEQIAIQKWLNEKRKNK